MKHLALAEFFFNIGRAILLLSFAKFLYDATGQVWQISLTFMAEVVISTMLPVIVGKTIDSHGVKRVLIGTGVLHVVFCLYGVLALSHWGVQASLLIVISIALSFLLPISRMALFSTIPLLVKNDALEKSNGLQASAFQGGQLLGMLLSAILLQYFGFVFILAFVTVVYAVSTSQNIFAARHIVISDEETEKQNKDEPESFLQLLKYSKRYLPYFVLSNFDFASIAIFNILLVPVVSVLYDGNTYWLAGLDASFAVGALIGGALIARQVRKTTTSITDVIAIQIAFILFLLLCLYGQFGFILPLFILAIGWFRSYSAVYWKTMFHQQFPKRMLGRLSSINYLVLSAQVGLAAAIVSYAHDFSFKTAIMTSIVISIVQLSLVLVSVKSVAAFNKKAVEV